MVTAVSTGSLFNPNFSGLSIGMSPSGSLSQYIENGSLFSGVGSGINPGTAVGGSYSTADPNYFNKRVMSSDLSTSYAFVNRSNQHSLASYGEIMTKNMAELASSLRTGEYGKAGKIYDELYKAISLNYGREIKTHQDRLNFDQSVKATINQTYQRINGTSIAVDASANDEGYLENGFLQGLTMGNHHKNCSEEIEAYMTGARIEGYNGKQVVKNVGRVAGTAANIGCFAAAGAAIGTVCCGMTIPGAVIGAAVGVAANVCGWLFSENQPTRVTEA